MNQNNLEGKEPKQSAEESFLKQLRRLSVERAKEGFKTYDNQPLTYWTTAIVGEFGELCNMIKKMKRAENGGHDSGHSYTAKSITPKMIREEIGGTLIYIDLLCSFLNIDLEEAIIETFNEKSTELGFPYFLATPPSPSVEAGEQETSEWRELVNKAMVKYWAEPNSIPSFNAGAEWARKYFQSIQQPKAEGKYCSFCGEPLSRKHKMWCQWQQPASQQPEQGTGEQEWRKIWRRLRDEGAIETGQKFGTCFRADETARAVGEYEKVIQSLQSRLSSLEQENKRLKSEIKTITKEKEKPVEWIDEVKEGLKSGRFEDLHDALRWLQNEVVFPAYHIAGHWESQLREAKEEIERLKSDDAKKIANPNP